MNEIHSLRRLLPAALGLLGLTAWTQAQTLTNTFNGVTYDRFGSAVAGWGDVNGDGRPDLVVGATQDANIFAPNPGFVRVYSSTSAVPIHSWSGNSAYEAFGAAVAVVGDISIPADGRADVIIGVPRASSIAAQAGQIQVRSGANGSIIHQINGDFADDQFGFSVAAGGDVDGDGVPDFVVGAPHYSQVVSNGGMVRVYSGATGLPIHTFTGNTGNGRFGWAVAAGDLNGDGRADIVVGSLFAGVRVYSGMTGSLMYTWTGGVNDIFGRSVSVVPNLGPGGVPGVAVGATQEYIFSPDKGYVRAFRGDTGGLLWTREGLAVGDRYGVSIGRVGDWNADGRGDVVVGAVPMGQSEFGYIQILSGIDGSVIGAVTSPDPDTAFGSAVAGLGDWNANGRANLAVGAPAASAAGFSSGQVRIYESAAQGCGTVTAFCSHATTNSTGLQAVLSTAVGSTSVAANSFTLACSQMPAGEFALAFYGMGQASMPLGNGFLCINPPNYRWHPPQQTGPAGDMSVQIDLTNPPSQAALITPGTTWAFQFYYRDSAVGAGSNLSTAIEVDFCP